VSATAIAETMSLMNKAVGVLKGPQQRASPWRTT
jgi:hypothetical protein